MMQNSEVKIVDAGGFPIQTVFSRGGQAIWDGKDQHNQPVSSGVYYFFATSEDGYSRAKSKVLIIKLVLIFYLWISINKNKICNNFQINFI